MNTYRQSEYLLNVLYLLSSDNIFYSEFLLKIAILSVIIKLVFL